MPKTRRSRGPKAPATSTTATVDTTTVTPKADQITAELRLIKGNDGDLFTMLLNGEFRLAIRCSVCGRWLTSHKSKINGAGPSCSARGGKR